MRLSAVVKDPHPTPVGFAGRDSTRREIANCTRATQSVGTNYDDNKQYYVTWSSVSYWIALVGGVLLHSATDAFKREKAVGTALGGPILLAHPARWLLPSEGR